MGMLYKRGKIFWIKYYCGGRPNREGTGTTKQKQAERFLKDREGRVAIGAPALPRLERIRFAAIADALIEHYEVTGARQLRDVQVKLKPVRVCFDNQRLVAIDQSSLTTYIAKRQAAGLTNATINRELALLRNALRLAQERGQILRVPRIHFLQESAPRSGFFEALDFERVRKHLANRSDLQVAVTIAYIYGWRIQSEVLPLLLTQVDLATGTLRLEPCTARMETGGLRISPQNCIACSLSRSSASKHSLER